MNIFFRILGSALLMSAIALSGSITLILKEKTIEKILLPLIAFAPGSLIGGALLHMLPIAITQNNHQFNRQLKAVFRRLCVSTYKSSCAFQIYIISLIQFQILAYQRHLSLPFILSDIICLRINRMYFQPNICPI